MRSYDTAGVFAVFREKVCEAGWGSGRRGSGVSGGVKYRDSRAVCLVVSSVTQDRHKIFIGYK